MEPNERVRVEPVPADAVAAVDEGHGGVGVPDERVGERHPRRAGPDHHVVGLQHLGHPVMLTLRAGAVNRCPDGWAVTY